MLLQNTRLSLVKAFFLPIYSATYGDAETVDGFPPRMKWELAGNIFRKVAKEKVRQTWLKSFRFWSGRDWNGNVTQLHILQYIGFLQTHCEVELAILDFFGQKGLYVNEELDVEGLGVDQPFMRSQLQKNSGFQCISFSRISCEKLCSWREIMQLGELNGKSRVYILKHMKRH